MIPKRLKGLTGGVRDKIMSTTENPNKCIVMAMLATILAIKRTIKGIWHSSQTRISDRISESYKDNEFSLHCLCVRR